MFFLAFMGVMAILCIACGTLAALGYLIEWVFSSKRQLKWLDENYWKLRLRVDVLEGKLSEKEKDNGGH